MRRLLLPAAAAACLLAAGCDYWRNLVDGKSVAQASLSLYVRDAWTRLPLPARCRDEALGFDDSAGADGWIRKSGAGTGHYAPVCSSPAYFDARAAFDLRAEGNVQDTVELARKGGVDWYPGDFEKQFNLAPVGQQDTVRVPTEFKVDVTPADSTVFNYKVWISRRPGVFKVSPYPSRFPIPLAASDTGTLVFYASVFAQLGGKSYLVKDSVSWSGTFVRNKKPTFTINNFTPLQYACPDTVEPINFSAADSDGHCDSVVFSTDDPNSVLGRMHRDTACSARVVYLPVRAGFAQISNQLSRWIDSIHVGVWDDNLGHTDTVLALETDIHPPPKIPMFQYAGPARTQYVGSPVILAIKATDALASLSELDVDWKDGTVVSYYVPSDSQSQFLKLAHHTYTSPGTFAVSVQATGGCDVKSEKVVLKQPVKVVVNTPPTGQFGLESQNLPFVTLRARAGDADFKYDDNSEALTLNINWQDSGIAEEVLPFPADSVVDTVITHKYLSAPTPPFNIAVIVNDAHHGADTVFVPVGK